MYMLNHKLWCLTDSKILSPYVSTMYCITTTYCIAFVDILGVGHFPPHSQRCKERGLKGSDKVPFKPGFILK